MDKEEIKFNKIAAKLSAEIKGVAPGKMMSAPGIKYNDKVFAFYWKNEMIFRLGKEFDPAKHKITKYSLLNPFKNRPPMAGWFQITWADNRKWEKLARMALETVARPHRVG